MIVNSTVVGVVVVEADASVVRTPSGVKNLTKVTCVQNVGGLLGEQRLTNLGGGSIMVFAFVIEMGRSGGNCFRDFISGLVAWYPDENVGASRVVLCNSEWVLVGLGCQSTLLCA